MNKVKKEKGITLVALIITIIVLLILAVVAIRAVTGDGILQYAQNSANTYNKGKEDEEFQIQNYVDYIENKTKNKKNEQEGEEGEGGNTLEITAETSEIKFTRLDGTEVTGEALASVELKNGDKVEYGDYRYHYSGNGWTAHVIDKTKTSYGQLATTIFNKPLLDMSQTFKDCTNLTVAPKIPNTVISLGYYRNGVLRSI